MWSWKWLVKCVDRIWKFRDKQPNSSLVQCTVFLSMTQVCGVVKSLGYTAKYLSSSVDIITQGALLLSALDVGGRHGSSGEVSSLGYFTLNSFYILNCCAYAYIYRLKPRSSESNHKRILDGFSSSCLSVETFEKCKNCYVPVNLKLIYQ